MTQLEQARNGDLSQQASRVASLEKQDPERLRQYISDGLVVIPANPGHTNLIPRGIGRGLSTKVNANIGTSSDIDRQDGEIKKLTAAIRAGADAVMDLSTGGDITSVRRTILRQSPVPVGTVPIYQAAINALKRRGAIVNMTPEDIFDCIQEQAEDGVDFITVHCGVTREVLNILENNPRVTGIVSRGGSMLAGWIKHNNRENPLFERFDRLLQIARKHDVTLSLGDGLRPGCIADATDQAQLGELMVLGELVLESRKAGVQVMVEGPGHLPMDHIQANVQIEKRICHQAPFYVLGPLVSDIAAGYDHITGAIGGAMAAVAGADFLCYVTPAEHLGLPDEEDVVQGVMASRIAAHAADIVKGIPGARQKDLDMSIARRNLDWQRQKELAIDPDRFIQVRSRAKTAGKACTMCGDFCAIELAGNITKNEGRCF